MPVSVIENASFGNSGIVTANGIKFPATQVASADANTLDDYEEGFFTPTYAPQSSGFSTVSYNEQFGSYVKIGRQVTVQFYVALNSRSGGSGTLLLSNLPFTSSGNRQTVCTMLSYLVDLPQPLPTVVVVSGTATAELLCGSDNGTWAGIQVSGLPTSQYSAIQGTLIYFTN